MRVCATHARGGHVVLGGVRADPPGNGAVDGHGFAALVQWTLWGGAACMVASGLLSFALQLAHVP